MLNWPTGTELGKTEGDMTNKGINLDLKINTARQK